MESAKPIEAGCRAMSIADYSFGMIVGVVKHLGNTAPCECETTYQDWWLLDTPVPWSMNNKPYLPEKNLIRIDDPDIQDQLEEESRKSKLDKYKDKVNGIYVVSTGRFNVSTGRFNR